MSFLIITTLIWSFSFSLIGYYIAPNIDTWFAIVVRIGLAFILFLPFLRWRNLTAKQILLLMILGANQLGIMYIFYYQSFFYLTPAEVMLFTILTPLYVTLLYDLLKKQSISWWYFISAIVAVIGAAVIRYQWLGSTYWLGFLLVQGANIVFAIGQVGYKRLLEDSPIPQHQAFAWLYTGAFVVVLFSWFLWGDSSKLPTTNVQWVILLWLGFIASGLGYFMWNYGATKVSSGTLAIMNNMVIPVGLLVNFIFWGKEIHWDRFILGSGLMLLALWMLHIGRKSIRQKQINIK